MGTKFFLLILILFSLDLKAAGFRCENLYSLDISKYSLPKNQNELWKLVREGKAEMVRILTERTADYLRTEDVQLTPFRDHNELASEVFIASFPNGMKAIWKPVGAKTKIANVKSEVGIFLLDQILELNIVPLTVARTIQGRFGSMQLFVEGKTLYEISRIWFRSLRGFSDVPKISGKILFLGLLTADPDRMRATVRKSNISISIEESQAALDNGNARFDFEEKGYKENFLYFSKNTSEFYPGRQFLNRARKVSLEELKPLEIFIDGKYQDIFHQLGVILPVFEQPGLKN